MMNMKTILLACLIISIVVPANATLSVHQKRVFAEDSFTVTYSVSSSQIEHLVKVLFQDQEQEVLVPASASPFHANVSFKAPTQPGEYPISAKGENINVIVEKPMLVIERMEFSSGNVGKGESVDLAFKLKNQGEFMVYNVNYQVVVTKNPGMYMYDPTRRELGSMKGGESRDLVETIKASTNAKGSTSIQLIVEYEFDGEHHRSKAEKRLAVSGLPWIDGIIMLLFLGAVLIVLIEIASRVSKRKT
ncbi:hypothetical protein K8R43_01795 [archaeon]|nr:hypothetical protein [archaeon]